MTARARVLAVLEAAREVYAARESLYSALVTETGLSRAGIALAFENHWERDVTEGDLTKLLAAVPNSAEGSRTFVTLAGNVFVAPVRALCLAVATSPDVVLLPSRRSTCIPHAFLRHLSTKAPLRVTAVSPEARDQEIRSAKPEDALHAYGSDGTLRTLSDAFPGEVWGHGHGFGAVYIHAAEADEAAARALARDIAIFDQQGCLSPRVVFVEGDRTAFARLLHEALGEEQMQHARGQLHADYIRSLDDAAFCGELLEGRGHAISLPETGFRLFPAARMIPLYSVQNTNEARALLGENTRFVTTVGTKAGDVRTALGVPQARLAALGQMQRPPLDGPVDLRHAG